jgi:hypothetical protein
MKERVQASRKEGRYSIIWDKTGNAANYFKTFERINMFGKHMCEMKYLETDDAAAAALVR